MRMAAFTVDVDRDVNTAEKGRMKAVSMETGEGCGPRFRSSALGLRLILDVLDELDIRATFFLEAETAAELSKEMDLGELLDAHCVASHGIGHEDLTGKDSEYFPDYEEVRQVVGGSADMIEDLLGRRPRGFRAPYLHADDQVFRALREEGYLYDSSVVGSPRDGILYPYRMPSGLVEYPVLRCLDAAGRPLVAYLWPMHEGNRGVEDYDALAASLRSGLMVMATHSWHLVETFCSGVLDEAGARRSRQQLHDVLHGIREAMSLVTLEEYHSLYYDSS